MMLFSGFVNLFTFTIIHGYRVLDLIYNHIHKRINFRSITIPMFSEGVFSIGLESLRVIKETISGEDNGFLIVIRYDFLKTQTNFFTLLYGKKVLTEKVGSYIKNLFLPKV